MVGQVGIPVSIEDLKIGRFHRDEQPLEDDPRAKEADRIMTGQNHILEGMHFTILSGHDSVI